jgi:hypothetical protein
MERDELNKPERLGKVQAVYCISGFAVLTVLFFMHLNNVISLELFGSLYMVFLVSASVLTIRIVRKIRRIK